MKNHMNEYYLEHIEKALRGDGRFSYLIEEDREITLWNMLVYLQQNNLYKSYLIDDMEYRDSE